MNTVQVLALLAIVSMSIPAALAFMFWRERNIATTALLNLEHSYLNLQDEYQWSQFELEEAIIDRDHFQKTAMDLAGDFYDWQVNEELSVFGPVAMWGTLDGEVPF